MIVKGILYPLHLCRSKIFS